MNFKFEWQEILFLPRGLKIHIFERFDDFDDFPKISDHFPKISDDFPNLLRRPNERSRTFSENFRKVPNMSENSRRLPKPFEEDPSMFRLCTNKFKYNLRDKLDISVIIAIFTCEDILINLLPLGIPLTFI